MKSLSILKKIALKTDKTEKCNRFIESPESTINRFKRHSEDCGSPEVQIVRLTARISQLSAHLLENKHDNSTKRGLTIIIGKRSGLLRYLERCNRQKYLEICDILGIKKTFGILS
jgi:small subunit ribosomal protein S15